MGGERGKFQVGLKPGNAGTYWIDFVYQGRWAAEAYKLPIAEGANCPEVPYEGKQRALGTPPPQTPSSPLGASLGASSGAEEKQRKEEAEKQRKEEAEKRREDEKHRKVEAEKQRKEEAEKRKEEAEEKKRLEDKLRKEEEDQERVRIEIEKKEEEEREREKVLREEEERVRREIDRKEEEERERERVLREEQLRKEAKLAEIRAQLATLDNATLSKEIDTTLERLQLLVQEQKKRIQ